MNNEGYASYELALKLKECGFNEPCIAQWACEPMTTGERFDYPYIKAVIMDGCSPKEVSAVCSGLYAKKVKNKTPHKYRNNLWYYA